MAQPPKVVKHGDIYFCEPDPQDTVGSEQEKDRPWVVVSVTHLHRGNCVVCIPLSSRLNKGVAHLIQIPANEIQADDPRDAKTCIALTDQIRALDKTRFRRKVGTMSQRGLNSIIDLGLRRLFGI